MKATHYFSAGILIIVIGSAFILKAFLPFDGLEFNGDSYRYYLAAINFSESIQELKLPESAFWPYGFPSLIGILFQFIPASFTNAQLVPICLAAGLFLILFLIIHENCASHSHTKVAIAISFLATFSCGFILKYQLLIMADIPALFWAALTIYFLLRYIKSNHRLLLLMVAFSTAFALLNRYVYGLTIIPIVFSLWHEKKTIQSFLIDTFIFLFGVFACCIPQLLIDSPSMYSSSFHHPWVENWSLANFWVLDRTSVDGHLHVQNPNFIYYLRVPFVRSEFTWAGLLIFLAGIFFSVRNGLTLLSKIMLVWFFVFYLFLAGIPIQNPRFTLCLYVPILFFFFEFFRHALKFPFKPTIVFFAGLYIAVKLFFSVSFVSQWIDSKNEMLADSKYFLTRIPPNSLIITWDFYEAYFIYSPQQKIEKIHGLTKEKATALFGQYPDVFLIFDEQRLTQAWGGLEPEKNYRWLKENFTFSLMEKKGRYSVWRSSHPTANTKSPLHL